MGTEYILAIIGYIVSIILGFAAKKFNYIDKHIIPVQNLTIGVVMAIVEYIITKDFHLAVGLSGLTAGGAFDIISNLNKLKDED